MFRNCKTQEDLKSLFRKLAMRLHPDYGGSNELMILCKNCYEESSEIMQEFEKMQTENKDEKIKKFYEKTYQDVNSDDVERLKIITEILQYAEDHKGFKVDFVKSVINFLEENLYMTSSQYNSLVKIYYAFKMDEKK